MRAHRLTMSKLSLAHQCTWSFRMDAPQHPRPSGKEARIGTLVHRLMEAQCLLGQAGLADLPDTADPEECTAAVATFSDPLRAYLDSRKWTAVEIGLRYDAQTDTSNEGPRRGEPGYADIGPTELAGTLDLVDVTEDCVDVLDLKSGKLVQDREQLYGQAVAAARRFGKSKARVGYLYARKTKCDEPEWETLDSDRLDEEAGRIARVLRRLPTAEPKANASCWKCDSRPACPAFGAAQAVNSERALEEAGFFL